MIARRRQQLQTHDVLQTQTMLATDTAAVTASSMAVAMPYPTATIAEAVPTTLAP